VALGITMALQGFLGTEFIFANIALPMAAIIFVLCSGHTFIELISANIARIRHVRKLE